jgi:hypothetical protein
MRTIEAATPEAVSSGGLGNSSDETSVMEVTAKCRGYLFKHD